ncbi:MAG TPA: TatD family hydrolase [Candidatus Saccharimonadales bacterium]|nr:TatD family hydrolase [Candidatus Saccharimonadales bacterium]
MRLVDTHAHLHFPAFDADRPAVIAELARLEIGVIEVATDQESAAKVDALATENSLIWGVLGLHPTEIGSQTLAQLPELMKEWQKLIAANPKIVAIGEIGLDYFRDQTTETANRQKAALREMLTFAADQKLPVIFHCRDAYGDLATILADYPGLGGVIHCFSGTAAQAEAFLALGLHLSATAIVTYPKNTGLAEVFKTIPTDRLMLETDSPFLPPVDNRGGRNDPKTVEKIATFLAELRGVSTAEIATITTQNAKNLFKLK